MKILYVSQYFPPEMGAPAARAAELAYHWTKAGHQVSVLTGFPNHPTGVVPPEWRSRLRRLTCHESVGLVDVCRTWLWPLPNRKSHERMRNYASFCFSAALRGLTIARPDVIIATSPQLLVGLAGWWLALSHQVPFVFEVRDLWPESLAAVGVGKEDSLLHHALAGIARFLYERADQIAVVTPAFKQRLIEAWRVPPEKISVVENGVETELFAPSPETTIRELRKQLNGEDRFLVSYIGTMGNAHGLETLLDAAMELQQHNTDVLFLLIGEGAEKQRIKALAQSRALTNVQFLDQQPREKIPQFISASDACLVLLKKTDIFKTVIPTKMLEFMSCARPVILGVDGQAHQIVKEATAGIAIEPENPAALMGGLRIVNIPVLLGDRVLPWYIGLAATVIWVLAITNAFNLIDGLDGLAAGSALFSTMVVFVGALLHGPALLEIMTISLAGAILGFLRYNFNPATIFLGDSGSLFIGFLLSALALYGAQKAPTIVAVAIPIVSFGLPILETVLSIIRRLISGRPVFTADREHIHHKLLQHSLTHRQVVILLYGVSASFAMLSLFLLWPTGSSLGLVLAVLGIGIWIGVQHLGYLEFGELARVAQRTLNQPQIFVNNLAIRRATEELKVARDYEQLRRILLAAFGSNDFDGFELKLDLLPGEVVPVEFIDPSTAQRRPNSFRWTKPGVRNAVDAASAWTIALDLWSSAKHHRGALTVYRLYSARDLQLDVNLLTGEFPIALADALDRTLVHTGAVITLPGQDTSLATAQAG